MKFTSPAPTKVIQVPETSMVATAVLLLLYVIAPLLSLVGRVKSLNDASPNVLLEATENVVDDSVGTVRASNKAIPLEFIPSPPYKVYGT
jgi:hypothetical protein